MLLIIRKSVQQSLEPSLIFQQAQLHSMHMLWFQLVSRSKLSSDNMDRRSSKNISFNAKIVTETTRISQESFIVEITNEGVSVKESKLFFTQDVTPRWALNRQAYDMRHIWSTSWLILQAYLVTPIYSYNLVKKSVELIYNRVPYVMKC